MSRRGRAGIIAALGIVAAVISYAIGATSDAGDLALLATGVVLGELFVLKLEDRSSVPLSFAVMIVLASSFDLDQYAAAVVGAELVAFLFVPRGGEPGGRFEILCARLLVASATFAAYRGVAAAFGDDDTPEALLTALGAAAAAQFVTEILLRTIMKRGKSLTSRGWLAWLAVASSGILMAGGYHGIDEGRGLGIWGPILFATPLAAAWYAFERLDAATLAYRQTIESLAMAPELAGLVPLGHAERVAALVAAMGQRLDLSTSDLDDLEMAALLHHLGQLTLDDPEVAGRPDATHVAAVTSGMLREIRPLAGAGDIVAGDAGAHDRRLAVQVLRVASEYDDLTVTDRATSKVALETLRTEPRYVYDDRVLSALERAVADVTSSG